MHIWCWQFPTLRALQDFFHNLGKEAARLPGCSAKANRPEPNKKEVSPTAECMRVHPHLPISTSQQASSVVALQVFLKLQSKQGQGHACPIDRGKYSPNLSTASLRSLCHHPLTICGCVKQGSQQLPAGSTSVRRRDRAADSQTVTDNKVYAAQATCALHPTNRCLFEIPIQRKLWRSFRNACSIVQVAREMAKEQALQEEVPSYSHQSACCAFNSDMRCQFWCS